MGHKFHKAVFWLRFKSGKLCFHIENNVYLIKSMFIEWILQAATLCLCTPPPSFYYSVCPSLF